MQLLFTIIAGFIGTSVHDLWKGRSIHWVGNFIISLIVGPIVYVIYKLIMP